MIARSRFLAPALLMLAAGCTQTTGPRLEAEAPPPPATRPAMTAGHAPEPPGRPELPAEPTLSDYLSHAALRNPGLAAAFHRWKAALEVAPQVRALPDPRFTYAYYIQEVETRVGPQRNSLQLAQTFPWLGTLRLRGDVAGQAAEAARLRYEAEKLKLFYRVKDAYYEYYYLGRAVATTQENLRLLGHLESVVRTRYKTGAARPGRPPTGHADLIRLQVELGKLEDRLRSLRDMRRPMMARLAAALGLPAGRELPWPREVEPADARLDDEQLVAWAGETSPELRALDADAAGRRKQVALARKARWPDVTLGLTWIDTDDAVGPMRPDDSGTDPWIASVSIHVPVWPDKLEAGVREAHFRHLAALKQRADASNDLAARVKLAGFRCRDAQGKLRLYRRVLLPRATESLQVTEKAFLSGEAGFSDLIDAQRVLLEFQLAAERALADRARHLAHLEMLVGRELRRPIAPADGRPGPDTKEKPE